MNCRILFVCVVAAAIMPISRAQTFNLSDLNTSATVNANSGSGLADWSILGSDQVFTNTYLWRLGSSGTASFLQNLTLTGSSQLSPQQLKLTYTNLGVGFTVDVFYQLTGGTEFFDLAEVVRVTNTSQSNLQFSLFQYNDFNLRTSPDNDVVVRTNSSTMDQGDGDLAVHYVVTGATPIPKFSQLGNPFLSTLTTTPGYNLDTAMGNGIGQSASGDVAYAFQWDQTLGPGTNFTISTNKVATAPEPASMFALAMGAVGLAARRRRQRR
jgi:hypothetical protein